MADKKGVIEIQFNWIFILVAGSLILLFFFGIIRWAYTSSAESSSTTISNYIDSLLTGTAVTEKTVNKVTIPFKKLEFTCTGIRVDNSQNQKNIRNKIIFAPSRLEKNQMITWSLSWDVPFRITNFLFVSSPLIRYIFIGDEEDEIFKYLKKSFPEEFNAEFNPTTIEDLNNFKVRVIYVNPSSFDISPPYLQDFRKMTAEDVTALEITGSSFEEVLDLSFFNKYPHDATTDNHKWNPTSGGTSHAFCKASLIAAIFSENVDDYNCNMEKAFKRAENIANIYKQRSSELHIYYDNPMGVACQIPHQTDKFTTMISAVSAIDYERLVTAYLNIKSDNNLAQQNSCALIY